MRVNVDSSVFTDARFKLVARETGLEWHNVIGKCVHIWMSCYDQRKGTLRKAEADCLVEHEGFANALCAEGLAIDRGDNMEIRGFKQRADWLKHAEESGKKGGRKSGESRRNKTEGYPSTKRSEPFGDPEGSANPLTLTLTHAQALAQVHAHAQRENVRDKPALLLARCAVDEINRLTGKRFNPEADGTVKLAKALVKAKRTEAEVLAVIRDKHAEWGADAAMAERVAPGTLLAAKNFARYLDELSARGGKPRASAVPRAAMAIAPTRRLEDHTEIAKQRLAEAMARESQAVAP